MPARTNEHCQVLVLLMVLVFLVACGNSGAHRDTGGSGDPRDVVEDQKRTASDARAGDEFGDAVAVSGDVAVVGAPNHDDPVDGANSGAAYILRFDGTVWIEEQKLTASDAASGDNFGSSVDVAGSRVVVGAPNSDGVGGVNSGSVYVYDFDGMTNLWVEIEELTASDGAASDSFGGSVAVLGDVIAIGSENDDDNGSASGSTYVFRFDGTNWGEEEKLTASNGGAGDRFGGSVAVASGVVVVGAAKYDGDIRGPDGEPGIAGVDDDGINGVDDHGELCPLNIAGVPRAIPNSDDDCDGVSGLDGAPGKTGVDDDSINGVDDHGELCPFNGSGIPTKIPGTDDVCEKVDSGQAYVFRFDGTNWVEEQKLSVSSLDSDKQDAFGNAVSISGDVIAIGVPSDDDAGSGAGSMFVFRFDGANWVEEQKLFALDAAAGDSFGASLAVSGDVLAVGATGDDTSGINSGSSYVFRFDGMANTWVQEQKFTIAGGAASDGFGSSIDVSGDAIVAGSPGDDDAGSNSGSAYAFGFDATDATWDEEQKFTAFNTSPEDTYGASVAAAGDVMVIGSMGNDDSAIDAGAAYIVRFNGTTGIPEQKLTASDAAAGDAFGGTVAASEGLIAIAAIGDDDNGSDSGSVYVVRFVGTDWVEEEKLTAADGAADDAFGTSLAVAGDVMVVGAVGDDDFGTDSGAAYVFRFDGTSWSQETKLTASDASAGDTFGGAVGVSGDVIVVGACCDDDAGSDSGAAYVFHFDGANWSQTAKLTASDAAAGDEFGISVAAWGQAIAVGAYRDGGGGSAYVYRLIGSTWSQEQKLTASDSAAGDEFGGSVTLWGDVIAVGAAQSDDAGTSSGSAYVFRYNGTTWIDELKLKASDEAMGDEFGGSVAAWGDVIMVGAPQSDGAGGSNSGSAYIFEL